MSINKPEKFGKYFLLDPIATGGMAELHRAKITGEEDEHCWSGWGLTERRKELILKLWSMPEDELPNKICGKK